MKSFLAPALLALVSSFLGSCGHPDAGLYAGRNELLRISRSGHLEWAPPSKRSDQFEYQSIGVLAKPDAQGDCHLVMASANPFLGSSVHFSPDRQTIDVTWRSHVKRLESTRETRYRKR